MDKIKKDDYEENIKEIDNFLINDNNFLSALMILLGSTCYVIGGVLTLKISDKKMKM